MAENEQARTGLHGSAARIPGPGSRGRRWTIVALVAVLLSMGGITAAAFGQDRVGARDAASAYLTALADGDGQAAAGLDEAGRRQMIENLTGATPPGFTDLIGTDGLSMAAERLSAPAVHAVDLHGDGVDGIPRTATAHASYTLAGRTHRATLELASAGGTHGGWQVTTPLLTDVRITGPVNGVLGIDDTSTAAESGTASARLLYPGVYELAASADGFTPTSARLGVTSDGSLGTLHVVAPQPPPDAALVSALQSALDDHLASCVDARPTPGITCGREPLLSISQSPVLTLVRPGVFESSGTATFTDGYTARYSTPVLAGGTFEYRDGAVTLVDLWIRPA